MNRIELTCDEGSNKYAHIYNYTDNLKNKYVLVYDSVYKAYIIGKINDVESYIPLKVINKNTQHKVVLDKTLILYIDDEVYLLDEDEIVGYNL